jgi:hypothetical protein
LGIFSIGLGPFKPYFGPFLVSFLVVLAVYRQPSGLRSPRELGNGSARQGTPGNWPLKKIWQPLPHQTGLLSMGISSSLITAFEIVLLKSPRSKWAQINQRTKALRSSHRAELFIFGPCFFVLFSRGSLRARPVKQIKNYESPTADPEHTTPIQEYNRANSTRFTPTSPPRPHELRKPNRML